MQQDLFIDPRRPDGGTGQPALDPALSQWFTPAFAAEMLVEDALSGLGDVAVVEPSCGAGAILAAIPAGCDAIGVEIDPRMAEYAARTTGRPVVVGDFRHAMLPHRRYGALIANPPFESQVIDDFVARAHDILETDGIAAMILPAHVLTTPERIDRWSERFSIEQRLLPRSLFPRLSLPLVWTRMIKGRRHSFGGFMLFGEASAIQSMPKEVRDALGRRGAWREAIRVALEALGGEATLREIYAAVEPRRPTANQFWRDKIRQELPRCFVRVDETRWRLPEAA